MFVKTVLHASFVYNFYTLGRMRNELLSTFCILVFFDLSIKRLHIRACLQIDID